MWGEREKEFTSSHKHRKHWAGIISWNGCQPCKIKDTKFHPSEYIFKKIIPGIVVSICNLFTGEVETARLLTSQPSSLGDLWVSERTWLKKSRWRGQEKTPPEGVLWPAHICVHIWTHMCAHVSDKKHFYFQLNATYDGLSRGASEYNLTDRTIRKVIKLK